MNYYQRALRVVVVGANRPFGRPHRPHCRCPHCLQIRSEKGNRNRRWKGSWVVGGNNRLLALNIANHLLYPNLTITLNISPFSNFFLIFFGYLAPPPGSKRAGRTGRNPVSGRNRVSKSKSHHLQQCQFLGKVVGKLCTEQIHKNIKKTESKQAKELLSKQMKEFFIVL